MLPTFNVHTIQKVEIALLDMFNDLTVNKYTDITRKTYTKTVNVPIFIHADKNFANHWRNSTKEKIPMPLPSGGLKFKGISPNNANRTQTTYGRNIFSKATQQWISDIQPTPFILSYELEFITDNRGDWGQLIENTIPYFNVHRSLRIKEFDFAPDIESKINVKLDNISTIFEDEIESNSSKHRFMRIVLDLKCEVDLFRPFQIPEVIKYAEMNVNIGEFMHKHQVFVYPDPIAVKEKKEWESLAPTIRDGLTLLKTVAGTLVKEVDLDGNTVWKNITLPDANRPVKVPNYKELSLNFDFDTPNEIDQSGFGRDFVALNDSNRTYIPDFPPGSGQYAPDGYRSNTTWNNILTWFGSEDGLNGAPYTFDIILQFTDAKPIDTIFQTLHNVETPNYKESITLPAGEVYFEWGLISSKLYFTMRTVKLNGTSFIEVLSQTFTTEKELDLNNTSIYKMTFVLYDKGYEGVFGYSIDGGPTIALTTIRES